LHETRAGIFAIGPNIKDEGHQIRTGERRIGDECNVCDLVDAEPVECAPGVGRIVVRADSKLPARTSLVLIAVPRGVELRGEQVALVLVAVVIEDGERRANAQP
jgi:hypothetical protein